MTDETPSNDDTILDFPRPPEATKAIKRPRRKAVKLDKSLTVRFTDAQFEALTAACPPGAEFAAFVRQCALEHLNKKNPERDLLRSSVAVIIAALSPELTLEDALALFDEHAIGKKGGDA